MIACVAVTVKDVQRHAGARIAGLTLHGDREWDRPGDRGALANRDAIVVLHVAPELCTVEVRAEATRSLR